MEGVGSTCIDIICKTQFYRAMTVSFQYVLELFYLSLNISTIISYIFLYLFNFPNNKFLGLSFINQHIAIKNQKS